MYVFITFPYSFDVDLAISELQKFGYTTESVFTVPLQPFHRSSTMLDMMSEESSKMFDLAMVLATMFMLLGVIYGYVLEWGPIIWGFIGIILGGLSGIAIQAIMNKIKHKKWRRPVNRQILLMIHLQHKDEVKSIEEIVKSYGPTGFATVDMEEKRNQYLQG